ncbi:MAG: zf-HC2 domain-containing protein [Firmicutes bacterium]|nr:zf-HC2 domain-containing protein [Bacillota bacterium]
MDNNCIQFRDMLPDFRDNNLSVEDRARVQEHLAVCDNCRHEVLEMEKLGRLFRDNLPEEMVPPVLLVSTWKAIEDSRRNYSMFDFLFTRKGLAWSMGAYVVGLFIIAMGYFMNPSDSVSKNYNANAGNCSNARICMTDTSSGTTSPGFGDF